MFLPIALTKIIVTYDHLAPSVLTLLTLPPKAVQDDYWTSPCSAVVTTARPGISGGRRDLVMLPLPSRGIGERPFATDDFTRLYTVCIWGTRSLCTLLPPAHRKCFHPGCARVSRSVRHGCHFLKTSEWP